jgi:hypothetical protein
MKHEKNERMEVYYEKLLKLANSFQHMTIDNFLATIFRYGLQPYLCSNNKHEEKNFATT